MVIMNAATGSQIAGGFSNLPSKPSAFGNIGNALSGGLGNLLGGSGGQEEEEEQERQKMLLQLLGQAQPQALDANFNTSNISVGGLR